MWLHFPQCFAFIFFAGFVVAQPAQPTKALRADISFDLYRCREYIPEVFLDQDQLWRGFEDLLYGALKAMEGKTGQKGARAFEDCDKLPLQSQKLICWRTKIAWNFFFNMHGVAEENDTKDEVLSKCLTCDGSYESGGLTHS
jgi:hypothetical protein